MASERLVTATGTVIFGVLSVVLWQNYLSHSHEVYGERDAAQAQIAQIDGELATTTDADTLFDLNTDRTAEEVSYQQAERRINDMDGWNSLEWKVKNSLRFAAPAFAVLFGVFTLLSVLQPLKRS